MSAAPPVPRSSSVGQPVAANSATVLRRQARARTALAACDDSKERRQVRKMRYEERKRRGVDTFWAKAALIGYTYSSHS
eukprot:2680272-Pleurochrysis_carterae.AAC.1